MTLKSCATEMSIFIKLPACFSWREENLRPPTFVTPSTKVHNSSPNESFKSIGIKIKWSGKGLAEKGIDTRSKKILVKIDKKYFRPNEVDDLRGNYSLARKNLKWNPKINFKDLVKEMIEYEINTKKKNL